MERISIGNQSFSSIREKSCFYIDKTDFIKEWWESEDIVTLITRPRRFGKTLNMNMLECFFSNQYAGRTDLFEGLSVWKDKKYQELQGTYPVIFLTFADIKSTNIRDALERINMNITDLYSQFDFLTKENILNEKELEQFHSVDYNMKITTAEASLRNLMKYLCRYYGKKVIILLDEYDTPMQEAYVSGYWDEMTSFFRSLFNTTFKTNSYLERAIMTGITRISKESIFSDLNNLEVVTTTSKKYEVSFGFTEHEVFEALNQFGLSDKKEEVKFWYDGFIFGDTSDIYNPWSITNFLDEKKFDTYWANTSSNSLIGSLLQQGEAETKEVIEGLLLGNNLETELDEQIIFHQLKKRKNAIWSLMLASGYLKVLGTKQSPVTKRYKYTLNLTNWEVKMMLEDMICGWFEEDGAHYNDFIKAFLQNDKKAMNHYMNKVALTTFSYFDTGKKPSEETEPEKFYHGFVLGLIVELSGRYYITSNRESDFGRYDVMLEPISPKDIAYVLEFKVYDREEEQNLQDTVANAHRQILEKDYDASLIAKGIKQENIRHYGFAFSGKKVLIG